MSQLQLFWDSLSSLQSWLWVIALFSTVFFLAQFFLTLFGLGQDVEDFDAPDVDTDAHDGIDHHYADSDSEGNSSFWLIKNLSIRTGVAYLMGMSWVSLWLLDLGLHWFLALSVGQSVGVFAFWFTVKIIKFLMAFQSNGSLVLTDAIGQNGKVSIIIPEALSSYGKVSIVVSGTLQELKAVTEGPALIEGELVTVDQVIDNKLVVKALEHQSVNNS